MINFSISKLLQKCFLDIIKCKLVVKNLVKVFLGLENKFIVFGLSLLLHHHTTPISHHFHFLYRFAVLQHQP